MTFELLFQIIASLSLLGGLIWLIALFFIADDALDYLGGVYHYLIFYLVVGIACTLYGASLMEVHPAPAEIALDTICWPWEALKVYL